MLLLSKEVFIGGSAASGLDNLELKSGGRQDSGQGDKTEVWGVPVFKRDNIPQANLTSLCELKLGHVAGFPCRPDEFCYFIDKYHNVQSIAQFQRRQAECAVLCTFR